jgi:hypothetical protein
VKTLDQPRRSRLGGPSSADSDGKQDRPPDRTGFLRRLRSVNARAARRAVLLAPIVLTACRPAILDPKGIVGLAQKMILIDSLVIMLAIVIPTIAATLAFAWWFRASNMTARYLPDWAFSGRIELIVWSIPLLVIMLLGGVAWIGSHDLDPAKPLTSNTPPLEVQDSLIQLYPRGWSTDMLGKLTWAAIPLDQPIPMIASGLVGLVIIGVLALP